MNDRDIQEILDLAKGGNRGEAINLLLYGGYSLDDIASAIGARPELKGLAQEAYPGTDFDSDKYDKKAPVQEQTELNPEEAELQQDAQPSASNEQERTPQELENEKLKQRIAELEAKIEKMEQSKMSYKISSLKDRLTGKVADAKESMTQTGKSALETAKDNKNKAENKAKEVAKKAGRAIGDVALVGLGLGIVAGKAGYKRAQNFKNKASEKAGEARDFVTEKARYGKEYVNEKVDAAKDKLRESKDNVKYKISALKDKVTGKISDAKEIMAQTGKSALETAKDNRNKAGEKVGEARDFVTEKSRDARDFVTGKATQVRTGAIDIKNRAEQVGQKIVDDARRNIKQTELSGEYVDKVMNTGNAAYPDVAINGKDKRIACYNISNQERNDKDSYEYLVVQQDMSKMKDPINSMKYQKLRGNMEGMNNKQFGALLDTLSNPEVLKALKEENFDLGKVSFSRDGKVKTGKDDINKAISSYYKDKQNQQSGPGGRE